MLLARGFGLAGPIFQSNNIVQAGGTLAPAATLNVAYTPPTGPTSPHYTVTQIDTAALAQGARDVQRQKDATAAMIATGTVGACPAGSLTSAMSSTDCYFNGNLDEGQFVPGTWSMWGVLFSISDVQAGRIDKTFTATDDQRFRIESSIIYQSIKRFGGDDRHHPPRVQTGQGSVWDVLHRNPEMAVYLDNFWLNPISPTDDELNNSDGWNKWVARGGYPIWVNLTNASAPLAQNTDPKYCKSILCACNGSIACVPGWLRTDDSQNWNVYVSIMQADPWTFTITLLPNNKAWYEQAAEFMEGVLTAIGRLFCDNKNVVVAQMTAAGAEKCIDAKKAPCKKGTPGCTCISPTPTAGPAIQAGNTIASDFCAGWEAENTPPVFPMPSPGNPPMFPLPPAQSWSPPIWMLALGGLAIGAYLFSRK